MTDLSKTDVWLALRRALVSLSLSPVVWLVCVLTSIVDNKNWWRWLWSDLWSLWSCHQRECGTQTRISQTSQTSAENGSDRLTSSPGQRSCLQISRRWNERAVQLRGDDIAREKSRGTSSQSNATILYIIHLVTDQSADSSGDRIHPFDWLSPSGRQTIELLHGSQHSDLSESVHARFRPCSKVHQRGGRSASRQTAGRLSWNCSIRLDERA